MESCARSRTRFAAILVAGLVSPALVSCGGGSGSNPAGGAQYIFVGNTPEAVLVDPSTSTLFVANSGSQNLSLLDTSGRVATRIAPLLARPIGIGSLSIGPGNRLFAAAYQDNQVVIVDRSTGAITGRLLMDGGPIAVATDLGRDRLYVAKWDAGRLSVVTASTGASVADVAVGRTPASVAVDPVSGEAWVANEADDTVSVVDPGGSVASIPVGMAPSFVTIGSAGRVYVSNSRSNSISVIDPATRAVTDTIAVGAKPDGLAYDSLQRRIYIAEEDANDLAVLDEISGRIIARVPVSPEPDGVAVDPTTHKVYVTAEAGGAVAVLGPDLFPS